MTTLPDTLASYVPALVVHHYRDQPAPTPAPAATCMQAALLFVDISGFTALAEQLGRNGPAGAEQLGSLLNTTFSQILDLITSHGGDVVKFAGDALLAVWKADEGDTLAEATLRAVQCGQAIHIRMQRFYSLVATVHLSLRIGVAAGEVTVMHLGGVQDRWEVLLAGEPVRRVGAAEHRAQPGDVVITPEAWSLIAAYCSGTPIIDDAPELRAEPYICLRELHAPLPLRRLHSDALSPVLLQVLQAYIPGAVMGRLVREQTGWLAELRRISVLFVTLPAFDDATAIQRVQQVMEALQTVVYRYEGSLNKLAIDDKGVMLVAAFGLPPFAHEDDAARAVQAALAIQSALGELHVSCAVGVTTGRAFCGEIGSDERREYTMIGDVVNMAARLMQAASALTNSTSMPTVLCDATTRQLAETTGRLRLTFEPLLPIAVKGKSEPIPIFRAVKTAKTIASSEPLHEDHTAFVGRATERSRLNGLLNRLVYDRSGGTALIEGEAGMGKSRLVSYVTDLAAMLGVTVVAGGADPIDQTVPYYAWRTVFERLLGGSIESAAWQHTLQDLLGDAPALRARLSLLNAVLPLELPDTPQTASLTGHVRASATRDLLVQILQRLADRGPYLIVLEDAHWLDSLSWALALAVTQQVRSLVLVMTMRPLEQRLQPEYQAIRDVAHAHVQLDSLSPAESIELVCHRLGVASLPEPVAELIRDKAQGNPFFSEELAYALRDAGLIEVQNGECTLASDADLDSLSFPETVQGAIISRIDRLTATEQLTLKVASVVGRVFPVRAVHAVYPTAIQLGHLSDDLSHLAQLDITPLDKSEPEVAYSFKHAITHDVVYNLMLFAQRRRLHRAVAEWYEQIYPDPPSWLWSLLAYHWVRAEVVPRAVDALERAAVEALQVCSFEEARTLLEQAVSLLRGPGAQDVSDHETRLLLLTRLLGEARQYLADFQGAREALEESLAIARSHNHADGVIAALSRLGRLTTDIGNYAMAQAYLEESLQLAREIDDKSAVAHVLNNLGNTAFRQSSYTDAVAYYQEGLSIHLRLRDYAGVALAFNGLGNTMMSQGEYDEAAYFYEESLSLRRANGDRWGEASCLVNMGWLAHLRGSYTDARSFYDQSLTIYRSIGDQRGAAIALNNLGFTLLELRDYPAARSYLVDALRACLLIGTLPVALEAIVGIAHLCLREGDSGGAAELLAFATSHPAANVEVHLQADRALTELRPLVSNSALETALARGRLFEFETVIATLIPTHTTTILS